MRLIYSQEKERRKKKGEIQDYVIQKPNTDILNWEILSLNRSLLL
jgi:hypothetical protein